LAAPEREVSVEILPSLASSSFSRVNPEPCAHLELTLVLSLLSFEASYAVLVVTAWRDRNIHFRNSEKEKK
jgi:hypothetical protein